MFFCSSLFRIICFTLLLTQSIPVAAGEFLFNENCRKAYEAILSLRFEEGRQLLKQEKEQLPDNLIPYFIENYIDFFTIFINENEEAFENLEDSKDIRMDKLESGDKKSPYFLYTQAELHLQWAFARIKFEEYFTAFFEVRKAYKMLEENQRLFPEFVPNKKSLGVLHTLIGTIPDSYKWGVNILGLDGTIAQGMDELARCIEAGNEDNNLFYQESLILYTFLALYVANEAADAWDMIEQQRIPMEGNLLNHFVASTIAMRTGHNDSAIAILENRPQGPEYFNFPFLDYKLGLAKLHRLDKDADQSFHLFLNQFHGRNYIKDTYQKLAWHHLIHGDREKYITHISQVRSEGDDLVDSDKQALKEAKTGVIPHPEILKIRMLFDGGYYAQAADIINRFSEQDFPTQKDKLEFTYRSGRVFHRWGKTDHAITHYLKTIENGRNSTYYYTANAALQLGLIYEEKLDYEKARECYHICLSLKGHEYKNSLDQKAKAGLNRIKGKN